MEAWRKGACFRKIRGLGEGKEIAVKRIYFTIGFIVRGQKDREGFFLPMRRFSRGFWREAGDPRK
ncbi:MAG: hypothetical protein C6W57_03185 [Caldibacillus debilis]|nr:MAG: hypothetical protein C6W57_03185 [Caldibacillus debilis]